MIYDCFGIFNNWYCLPRLKIALERISKLTILKQLWAIKAIIIAGLVLYFVQKKIDIEIDIN
jgi:hypothetical protein